MKNYAYYLYLALDRLKSAAGNRAYFGNFESAKGHFEAFVEANKREGVNVEHARLVVVDDHRLPVRYHVYKIGNDNKAEEVGVFDALEALKNFD